LFNRIHHISIICSNYKISKKFYTEILGLDIVREVYRPDRESYKLDLSLKGEYVLELFSFPSPPKRKSFPEAAGLRHLAFEVNHIEKTIEELKEKDIQAEQIRVDEYTGKKFTFIADPDGLPIELYEK
jgi:glyoxylase I family protein